MKRQRSLGLVRWLTRRKCLLVCQPGVCSDPSSARGAPSRHAYWEAPGTF